MVLTDSIATLKGVGPKKVKIFNSYGIYTLEDLMNYFPRKYEDRRHTKAIKDTTIGEDALIEGKVLSRQLKGNYYRGKSPLKLLVDDGTGRIEVVFFNGKFISNIFKINESYSFYGKVTRNFGVLQMVHPDFSKSGDANDVRGIIPVYPSIQGISQKELIKLQKAIEPLHESLSEWLPDDVVLENRLADPSYAIKNIHFPTDSKNVLISKFRLIFEELITLETGLFYIKKDSHKNHGGIIIETKYSNDLLKSFSFELTSGQKSAWKDISSDLSSEKVMNRLIQGDVGSGKTAIAELAMYSACKSGYQSVMMAPTEILAKQHFDSLSKDFRPFDVTVALLCSNMKASEKREVLTKLESGDIDVLVGTHAVIQESVIFHKLGLAITDEQHRFGVNQRKILWEKGENINTLVMTATPIPRTLAVVIYGDLDVSIIDTMPAGRREIKTIGGNNGDRNKIYEQLRTELQKGHQAYVVAPLIDDSENIDAKSATALYEELSKKFSEYRVSLIHGNLSQKEKDTIMEAYINRKIDILVSTVVIEVGINVPNATVMIIENCERFGLSQMHQLRGRVGRSDIQSYCYLICEKDSDIAVKRMKTMCNCSDGFQIAEEDLKLRGPGELFGTRQHGLPELHISDLIRHVDVLEKAKNSAKKIIDKDPSLLAKENIILRNKTEKMFGKDIKIEL